MAPRTYQDTQPYSDLELAVDRSGGLEPVRYVPASGLEAVRDKPENDIQVVYGHEPKTHPSTNQNINYDRIQLEEPRSPKKRKSRSIWLAVAIVTVLVVVAAILGGVFGSKSHRNRSQSTTGANGIFDNNTSTNNTSPNNATALNVTRSIMRNTALASVAWGDTNGVVHYRVYYQDSNAMIKESAWVSAQQEWYVSNGGIGLAKNGTPLAVISTPDPNSSTPHLHLYYLSPGGELNEWATKDGATWQNGSINTQKIIPAKSSQLAGYSDLCHDNHECDDNVLLIYQDSQNTLQLYNATSESFTTSSIPANPIIGSGLGLIRVDQRPYPSQLRFFYQISSNDLVAADWIDASQAAASDVPGVSAGWNLHESTHLASFPPTAPIAAFVFGATSNAIQNYTDEAGFPLLVNALTSGSEGVTSVAWYPDGNNSWAAATRPPSLNAANNNSALAAHAWGSAYAMEGDQLVEYSCQAYDNGQWLKKGVVITS